MRLRIAYGIAASAVLAFASQSAFAFSVNASGTKHGYNLQARQSILPMFSTTFDFFQSSDNDAHGDKDRAYTAGLMFSPYVPFVDLSAGVRYQYQTTGYGDGGGVSVGGSAYVPTFLPMTSIGAYGFYTPKQLAHGDVHTSKEYGAQLRFNPIADVSVYGGYRVFSTEFDNEGSHRLDRGPFIGASVGF